MISTLTEFGRDGWGEGGDEFCWWCTEAPEAFVDTARPVYRSLEPELRKMLGDKLYTQVAAYLDDTSSAQPAPVVHPAEVKLLDATAAQRSKRRPQPTSSDEVHPAVERGTPRR